MKTIGLIGGMSWESTVPYYQIINREVARRLGGWHSARIVLYSLDFQEIEALQSCEDWDEMARLLIDAGQRVEDAGADLLLICTNTMHRVADQVAEAVSIPLLHIADAVAVRLAAAGHRTAGLLGTNFTMTQPFYRERLSSAHGIDTLIPPAADRDIIHRVIYSELCLGRFEGSSRREFLRIIQDLAGRGAQSVILGCTEIGLLVTPAHTDIPLLDTGRIHAEAAVDMALSG